MLVLECWGNNEKGSADYSAALLRTFVSLNMEVTWVFYISQNFAFRMNMNEMVLFGAIGITVNECCSN